MGIDFDLIRKPAVVQDAACAYRHLVEGRRAAGIVAAHDPTVMQSWQELRDLERQYHTTFSASWQAWRHYVMAMGVRNMVAKVAPAPQPDLAAYDYAGPCALEVLLDPDAPGIVKELVWDWLAQTPSVPGIAQFKLLSNDGWIVTADEAHSAIEMLGSQPAPDLPGWDRWTTFLRQASLYEGFQVT